ncbi:YbaN family protein [Enterococcus caccae]|uniref:DUF454 domain-containing protein n=1 Tax=Enterococcus caccae ATCC BAA-1240 TaxID=1158612 RepID=R3WPL2_9ENTE|nr:YbaN family protein [Enterococcus caccae]EOL49357.1 hypothetical protein UC7_00734 [Enterococcus caccae ATCC BAA-1240]EOT56409.1 hypothetical protein I580_03209 [Enterococcus caccae ATCC BAA-1240]OJG25286.1 hypothetical protein RU98_GL001111 [Enterococcus caccae]
MKKILYIALGCLTFFLGTLGIFLPILPTAIFYILTAFFWMRSSDSLYSTFVESTYYRKYIQESIVEKKITPLGRIKLFSSLFVVFAIPCLIVRNPFMTITLAIIFLLHLVALNVYFNKKNSSTLKEPNEQ